MGRGFENDRLQYFTAYRHVSSARWGPTDIGRTGSSTEPYDIKFDPHGNMYVADEVNDRVQKFAPDGTFITEFGTYGTGDGQFDDVEGVEPTSERYVVATDYDNDRVQRFFSASAHRRGAYRGREPFPDRDRSVQGAPIPQA